MRQMPAVLRSAFSFTIALFLSAASVRAQSNPAGQDRPLPADEAAIRKLMDDQAIAWNKGSIDDFMKGYWQNDSLIFIGKSGITHGYATTLANYKRSYKDTVQMGKLYFTQLAIKRISDDHCFVIGKWLLKRKIGDIGGIYSLLFRKAEGKWVIIADHTSD